MIKPKTKVKLGENSYPIYIEENIVSEIGNIIGKIGSFSKYILVTDSNVAKFYLKDVENSLKILQKPFKSIILRPGEKTNEDLISKKEVSRTYLYGDDIHIRMEDNLDDNKLIEPYNSKTAPNMSEDEMSELVYG